MLEIDGSRGEGGGQILRTSIALSVLTSTPCTITHIRANRPTPGLKPQHLTGLKIAAQICNATTRGITIGSQKVEFIPHTIKGGEFTVDIGTAGSVTLLLQEVIPLCLYAEHPVSITVSGGTDVKWSPSSSYFQKVFLPILKKMGIRVDFQIQKYGFYPRGGGKVNTKIYPWKKKLPLCLPEPGALTRVDVDSIASTFLRRARVAERQYEAFRKAFSFRAEKNPVVNIHYVETQNPGSVLCAAACCEHSVIGADSLGEKGKPAEKVGSQAAHDLRKEIGSHAALDTHMADQIIPYLALAGGEISVAEVTGHATTNIWVCQQFLDTTFSVSDKMIAAECHSDLD